MGPALVAEALWWQAVLTRAETQLLCSAPALPCTAAGRGSRLLEGELKESGLCASSQVPKSSSLSPGRHVGEQGRLQTCLGQSTQFWSKDFESFKQTAAPLLDSQAREGTAPPRLCPQLSGWCPGLGRCREPGRPLGSLMGTGAELVIRAARPSKTALAQSHGQGSAPQTGPQPTSH